MARLFDDETLMAFADGELDAEAAGEVERAVAEDEAVAARVALFLETGALARDAMRPLLEEPVPAELVRAVEDMAARPTTSEANVVPFANRPDASDRPGTARFTSRYLLPLAASLVAVAAGSLGYFAGVSDRHPDHQFDVAGLTNPAIANVLEDASSGAEEMLDATGQRVRIIASFNDRTGAFCREFEVDSADASTVVSVACRSGSAWTVNFAVVAPAANGGYAPASSTEALDAYLASIGANAPLSPEDEAAALVGIKGR